MKYYMIVCVLLVNIICAAMKKEKDKKAYTIFVRGKEWNLYELLQACKKEKDHWFGNTRVIHYDASKNQFYEKESLKHLVRKGVYWLEKDNFVYATFYRYIQTKEKDIPVGALILGRRDYEAIEEACAAYMSAEMKN